MTNQLPAHLQGLQAPDIAGTLSANLGSAMPPHVSIANNRFMLIDAGNNEIPVPTFDPQLGPYLDAAIVDVNPVMSRIYFSGQFDSNADGVRPDCFSDNGVGPSVASSSPQAPTCAACPRSEWTKVNANGKKVPWCSHKQKVALLIPGFQTLFLLAVPPNSHGPMREYVEKCKGNGANIADLITRISFVSQGTLQFQPISYIDAPTAQLRQAAYAEKKTDALVGRTDVARPASAIAAPNQIANMGDLNAPMAAPSVFTPPHQQITQASQWPAQQVQQPGPLQTGAASSTGWPIQPAGQPTMNSGVAPPNTSVGTAEPAPATRRRRRTAAEMAEANAAPANGQAPQQPAAAPQAPFPHPGQQTMPGGTAPQQPPVQPVGNFGIAQPGTPDAELKSTLDSFFGS